MEKEILIERVCESTLKVTGGDPSAIRGKDLTKQGARVFSEGKVFSSSYEGEIDPENLYDQALANQAGAIPFDYKLPEASQVQNQCLNEAGFSEQGFMTEYVETLATLKDKFPDFVFSGQGSSIHTEKSLKTTGGAYLSMQADRYDWSFLFKDKKSSNIIDGYFGASSVGKYDVQAGSQTLHKMLATFGNEIKLENKNYPVVFLTQDGLLSKLVESCMVDNYKNDIGLYKGQLGKKIVDERITLFDSTFDPAKEALQLFDGEGVCRQDPNLPLIEKGVFKNLISDLRNGKKYGVASTGNGQRNYKSGVRLGFNTLLFAEGQKGAGEILKGLDQCLLIGIAAGGEFTDEGDYSTPVQLAYMMENGELVGRLPQFSLRSSVQKMFGSDLLEIAKTPFSGIDPNPTLVMEMQAINH